MTTNAVKATPTGATIRTASAASLNDMAETGLQRLG